jgi:integrase
VGCLYRRGKNYWIKYYKSGKQIIEATHTDKKEAANRLLKRREGEISKGEIPGIYFDKIRFDELAEDFLTDYRVNGKKSLDKAERSVKHLKECFGGIRVPDITTTKIKAYIEKRMEEELTNASINRELAALKRLFHLGAQCSPPKVGRVPYIPMLKENNIRKGFFEHKEFVALCAALPFPVNSLVTFAYRIGWRKSELLGLTWDRVDLKQGIIWLDPGETKNREARTVYLDEELQKEIRFLHCCRHLGCAHVFQRDGAPVRDFRDAWEGACKTIGLWAMDEKKDRMGPTRIFHDFRRTAVRNMVRAGIPERVAMEISGHKTRSIFDRYHIVSQEDLKEAARRQQAYLKSQYVTADSYILVTSEKKMASPKRRPSSQVLDFVGAGGRNRTDTEPGPTGF